MRIVPPSTALSNAVLGMESDIKAALTTTLVSKTQRKSIFLKD
jgi:hypothetical protein